MTQPGSAPTRLSLWDWSVATYARPGVKDALLALQNAHGLDVNMILWRLWLAHSHREPTPAMDQAARTLSETWRTRVVTPLRSARDGIKPPPGGVDPEHARLLRTQILEVELQAERLQHEALERLSADATTTENDYDPGAALRPFSTEMNTPDVSVEEMFSPLIKALAAR